VRCSELLGLGFRPGICGERGNGDRREGDQVQRSVLAPPLCLGSVLVSVRDSGEFCWGEVGCSGWMLDGPPETFWGSSWILFDFLMNSGAHLVVLARNRGQLLFYPVTP
jgi:hypothetical protein